MVAVMTRGTRLITPNESNPMADNAPAPSHSFDDELPSDEDLRSQIVSVDIMDLPSRHQVAGNPAMLDRPITKVSALAPQHREAILAELQKYPAPMREAKEAELVQATVANLARASRMRSGPPDNASEYMKESWAIGREVADLETEMDDVLGKLTKVAHIDPVTRKETLAYPDGTAGRKALQARLDEITHAITMKTGHEGDKRLKSALDKSVAAQKAAHEERAMNAEANRRAAEMVREKQINRRAAARAKFLDPDNASWGE